MKKKKTNQPSHLTLETVFESVKRIRPEPASVSVGVDINREYAGPKVSLKYSIWDGDTFHYGATLEEVYAVFLSKATQNTMEAITAAALAFNDHAKALVEKQQSKS